MFSCQGIKLKPISLVDDANLMSICLFRAWMSSCRTIWIEFHCWWSFLRRHSMSPHETAHNFTTFSFSDFEFGGVFHLAKTLDGWSKAAGVGPAAAESDCACKQRPLSVLGVLHNTHTEHQSGGRTRRQQSTSVVVSAQCTWPSSLSWPINIISLHLQLSQDSEGVQADKDISESLLKWKICDSSRHQTSLPAQLHCQSCR